MSISTFIATFDLHWGYENRNGHKTALHDIRAWRAVLAFAEDFKPDTWILGGDILDCGPISHWSKGNRRKTEGLRLRDMMEECWREVLDPIEQLGVKERVFQIGNHEHWSSQFLDQNPELEGFLEPERELQQRGWKVIPQGGAFNLGKLTFVHGDTLTGGDHVAKAAVLAYERNVRFGHFHTYQAYTKTSALDVKLAKTGIAVPCLCAKTPEYIKGRPTRWVQGFLWGYTTPDGFHDYVSLILGGKTVINGKTYLGG